MHLMGLYEYLELTLVASGYNEVRKAASPIADMIRITNESVKKGTLSSASSKHPKPIFATPHTNNPMTKSRCAFRI